MKKLAKVLALAFLMVVGSQAMAQTHGCMSLGASFPMNGFADGQSITNTALGGNYDDGGAGIGFNAGLKWYFGVGVKGLGVMLSVDGFYNGPNADMKDDYKTTKSDWETWCDNVSVSSPKYINVPAMLGLNYNYELNNQFSVFAEAGIGGDMRYITDYNVKGSSKVLSLKNSVNNNYDMAFALAWQVGAGVEVSKNLIISCSLYDLGKASVKGETSAIVEGVETSAKPFEYGELHPFMVVGRIGFKF